MASRDPRPDPQLVDGQRIRKNFGTNKKLRVRLVRKKPIPASQTKATGHAIPSSPNAILSLPPGKPAGSST